MSDLEWNSVPVEEEAKPKISLEELRDMLQDLDPDDFDEPVQQFMDELLRCEAVDELKEAATLLLQDEIDLAPDLAKMGVEPDEGLIALLLAAGADPNARNAYGQPPLHLAAYYGYEGIVDMLLAAGASLRLRNHAGNFAADVAATPALAARLAPPLRPEEEPPLPPEIEDADYDPEACHCHEHGEGGHECHCHEHGEGGHECHCHEHGEGNHECHCHEHGGHQH